MTNNKSKSKNKKSSLGRFNDVHKLLFLLLTLVVLSSHDLYIKLDNYFLKPEQEATLSLYNGTFERSENIITRDRIIDASVVYDGIRIPFDESQWEDKDSTITRLNFITGDPGTYLVGVSTKARNIELVADKFNDYLEHNGILDMLKKRKEKGLLNQNAVESYQKHVKAIYQVGDSLTNDWKTVLNYPIEFVPLENPYQKYNGDQLKVKLILDGQPLANQLVYAGHIDNSKNHNHHHHGHDHDGHHHDHEDDNHDGHDHSHDHKDGNHHHDHDDDLKSESDQGHSHTSGQKLSTDEAGVFTVDLPEEGIYFLRTIHMVEVDDHTELTHESKWATLTFEVNHPNYNSEHTHDHHHHEDVIPTWVFILGSVVVIGILFFVFRKKG